MNFKNLKIGQSVLAKTNEEYDADHKAWKERHPGLSGLNAQPGDIIKFHNPDKPDSTGHLRVVGPDRHGHGFYYHPSDEKGEMLKDDYDGARPSHSNMHLSSKGEIVGNKPVTKKSAHGHSWHLTGDKDFDSQMANLDERYSLFDKHASKKQKSLYNRREDQNYHTKNAKTVEEFADWMSQGKHPDAFDKRNAKPVKPGKQTEPQKKPGQKAGNTWFKSLSKTQREQYLKLHPRSKFAKAMLELPVGKSLTFVGGK